MIQTDSNFQAFLKEKARQTYGFSVVQMPSEDGSKVVSQIMLPNIVSFRMKRSQDMSSDTCDIAFSDDTAQMFSANIKSKYGSLFSPGVIDNKFLVYLGYRGSTGSASSNLAPKPDTLTSPWFANNSQLVAGNNGPGGAVSRDIVGTGVGITGNVDLEAPISVVMGQTYTPSWWINPQYITHGTMQVGLADINDVASSLYEPIFNYISVGQGPAQRYALPAWTCPTNLVAYSDMPSAQWTNQGGAFATGGPSAAVDWEYTGTGAAANGAVAKSPAFNATPGQVVTLSGWCDFSAGFTGGSPRWLLWDVTHGTEIGNLGPVSGVAAGRFTSSPITIPAGCTQVQVWAFMSNLAVVASGQKLKFSQPMLEAKSSASGYYISSQNPQIKMYCFAWSGQSGGFIISNGNLFSLSQPMFEAKSSATPYYIPGTNSNFVKNNSSAVLQFTGYVATDGATQQPYLMDKNVSLIDLTSQFRMEVYDTFPHPIYGDQNLGYFDPTYNLTSTDGKVWTCDGKMFTLDNTSKQYGSTHIDPAVYVDTTGGQSPTSTAVPNTGWSVSGNIGTCNNYTFDYANGVVTFTTAYLTSVGHSTGLPTNSVVSVAGNPTYMAPEVMIRKLFVEKASWSASFIDVKSTGILLPQFAADGKSVWDCAKLISQMTNPRFVNWIIKTDENGMIHFYESNLDAPPVKTFINGKDLFNSNYEFDAKTVRTVVRADATTNNSNGDQTVSAIAFDVRACNRYGVTEPLALSTDVTATVRHLGPTQAISQLTMLCASALHQVSRPVLKLTGDIWPDFSLQISDKAWVYDNRIGMDREYEVTAIDLQGDAQQVKQTIELTEFYETVNFNLGLGSAVVAEGSYQAATAAPPSQAIVGGLRLGSGVPRYVYMNGDYVPDPTTGDPIVAYWTPDGTAMHFDYFLNSAQSLGGTVQPTVNNSWSYHNLPPGYSWTPQVDATSGDTVYYGTVPASPPYGGTAGNTVQVGPGNVFWQFNHASPMLPADVINSNIWVPTPGNTNTPVTGGTQTYTGAASNHYVWAWWYLCLDSNKGTGGLYRPVMRVNPALDGVAQSVPATGGLWVANSWTNAPGPLFDVSGRTKYYGNVVVGQSDYTTPASGFVGANVMNDGTHVGVSYGNDAPSDAVYQNYRKRTKGHFCLFVCNDVGQRQFLRVPFWLVL